jgi:hypothetical protein
MLAGESLDHRADAVALRADTAAGLVDIASVAPGHLRILSRGAAAGCSGGDHPRARV